VQEIGSCESDATKREVQAANTQKQLEKLRKELEKGDKEKAKLAAQQETTMKVGCPGVPALMYILCLLVTIAGAVLAGYAKSPAAPCSLTVRHWLTSQAPPQTTLVALHK